MKNDYIKVILNKIKVFEYFLESLPLVKKPSIKNIQSYQNYQKRVL